MTPHILSSAQHYLGNRATGKAYVITRAGDVTIVNLDALELLTAADPSWQDDPAYAAFLAQAVAFGWLVPASAPQAAPASAPQAAPASAPQAAPVVRWVDRRVHLLRLQYELNLLCNLKCAHCYCSSSPQAPPGLPTGFALDLVRQAAELGVIYFDFTGGEPLVRPDILELLGSARDLGMIPGLFTNCTLVTPALARELRAAGVAAVQTSLDARTPELHDEIRGKRGAFERAVRGVRACQDAGLPVSVTVCLNRKNVHETDALVRFLHEDLQVAFRLDRVIPTGRGVEHDAALALPNHEYHAFVRRYATPGGDAPTRKVCDGPGLAAGTAKIEPACGVGASYVFVKHDGRAALCPTMTEAESPDFAQADLRTMSLAQAWEAHPTFTAFRDVQCENTAVCPSGKSCRGGCRSNAYLLHGSVTSPDEASCNLYKNPGGEYRPFLAEYEGMRGDGRLPARDPRGVPARRRLPVLAAGA